MKYLSALFLVLLLAPFAFTQSEIELIEKSPEGKEVLEGLYLEISMGGPDVDVNRVRQRLRALETHGKNVVNSVRESNKRERQRCKDDLQTVGGRADDLATRSAAIQRLYEHAQRKQKGRATALERANEELSNLKDFRQLLVTNGNGWSKFWKNAVTNMRKAASLLSQTKAQVRALHRLGKKSAWALIEIPKTYSNALNEISSEFENTYDNLGGFRPVISNLLQILRSTTPQQLGNKPFRASLRTLIGKVQNHLLNHLQSFEQENEHQTALYSGLQAMYNDKVRRATRLVVGSTMRAKISEKKLSDFLSSVKYSSSLANQARFVVTLMNKECNRILGTNKSLRNQARTTLNYIDQVLEVVNDRWPSLKNFLQEKMNDFTSQN